MITCEWEVGKLQLISYVIFFFPVEQALKKCPSSGMLPTLELEKKSLENNF